MFAVHAQWSGIVVLKAAVSIQWARIERQSWVCHFTNAHMASVLISSCRYSASHSLNRREKTWFWTASVCLYFYTFALLPSSSDRERAYKNPARSSEIWRFVALSLIAIIRYCAKMDLPKWMHVQFSHIQTHIVCSHYCAIWKWLLQLNEILKRVVYIHAKTCSSHHVCECVFSIWILMSVFCCLLIWRFCEFFLHILFFSRPFCRIFAHNFAIMIPIVSPSGISR